MEKSKILNILDFYLDSMDDDIELINEELKNANINVDESEKKIMELLKNANAEVNIDEGRKLKVVFNKAKIEVETNNNSKFEIEDEAKYKLAARNIGNLTENDKNVIAKNLHILDRLGEDKDKV